MKVRFLKDAQYIDSKINKIFEKGKVFDAMDDYSFIQVRMTDRFVKVPKSELNNTFEILTEEEERIYNIHMQTGFDEITVGCYLSNYKVKGVCAGIARTSCKCLDKCKALEKMGVCNEKICTTRR